MSGAPDMRVEFQLRPKTGSHREVWDFNAWETPRGLGGLCAAFECTMQHVFQNTIQDYSMGVGACNVG